MIELKYFQDESVQSWIVRNLKVLGCSSYRSVIGPNGQWLLAPYFTNECSVDIRTLDDAELLSFLRRSGLAKKQAGIFENPVDYLSSVHRVFQRNDDYWSDKGSVSIRFCYHCIEESIREYGFAYFKSAWLHNVKCDIHYVPLIQLKDSTYKVGVNSLVIVMSGRELPDIFTENINSSILSKDNDVEEPPFHIMPCLLYDFYRWASMKRKDNYLEMSYLDFHGADLIRKKISDEMLHYYFATYNQKYPKQFSEFLTERAEIKEYWFGISQRCSLKENLLKSNKHNCSRCIRAQDHCPIQPIAKILVGDYYQHEVKKRNICDFFRQYGKKIPLI